MFNWYIFLTNIYLFIGEVAISTSNVYIFFYTYSHVWHIHTYFYRYSLRVDPHSQYQWPLKVSGDHFVIGNCVVCTNVANKEQSKYL